MEGEFFVRIYNCDGMAIQSDANRLLVAEDVWAS